MKKFLLAIVVTFCLSAFAFAQTAPSPTATIKGLVIDSVKKQPLSYVTVALVDAATNAPVKSTFTKDNGSFEFAALPIKPYKVTLVNIGFGTKTINLDKPQAVNDLGTVLMAETSGQLKEVNVTAVRPLMKREVDRISFDVQADPENKVLNVLDMLRKVPLLSVDATDAIKMQGNSNYRILINGKPSALIAKNPADIFRAMPASNIEKIEVITTPPAKYDGEGLAGIINIITKKNADQGYNGTITPNYSSINGAGINLNLSAKQGKFGIGGYLGYSKRNTLTTGFNNINDIFGQSYLTQDGTRKNSGNNAYGSAELSFEADSLNLLTGTIEYYRGKQYAESDQASMLTRYATTANPNPVNTAYRSLNDNASGYVGIGGGLNYQLGFKRNKDQLLTASYKYNLSKNNDFNDVMLSEKLNFNNPSYQQFNKAGTKEHTIQLDYVQPVKKLNIEAGAKAIYRNNYSDFRNDNQTAAGGYVTDPAQSYSFDYQQNVYSIYNSYQLKLTNWAFKAGLRGEHTTVDANDGVTRQEYNNLIPSISMQRSFKTSSITLGYADRIQRPGIWQLNPFVNSSNPNFVEKGNPNLRPVVSHGLELAYSNFKKGSINISLNYKFANNTIEQVVTPGGADAVSVTTYDNVGKNKRLGADLSINYPITTKFNVNLNGDLQHVWLRGLYNGVFYDNKGFQGDFYTGGSYKFDNGFRTSVNFNYASRYVMLQGKDNNYISSSASVSKEMFAKKATLSLSLSNPFSKYRRIDNYNRTDQFYQLNAFDTYYRRINISFNYKFGRLNSDIKKNKRGISNDDVTSGGRN